MKKTANALLIGLLLVAITGLLIERLSLYQGAYDIGYQDGYGHIKSIKEFQMQVGAVPDSKWGKESNEKHKLAYGQQGADIWINAKSMGIEK